MRWLKWWWLFDRGGGGVVIVAGKDGWWLGLLERENEEDVGGREMRVMGLCCVGLAVTTKTIFVVILF